MLLQMGEDLPFGFVDESTLRHARVDSGKKRYKPITQHFPQKINHNW